MNKEQSTIEAAERRETLDNPEVRRSIESPEEFRQQIIIESEKEAAEFKKECIEGFEYFEARAEKDGLSIEDEDKQELLGLIGEANVAREGLITEVTTPPLPNIPPPFPEDYLQKYPSTLLPLPSTLPPLPEDYENNLKESTSDEDAEDDSLTGETKIEKETANIVIESLLQKSKIVDRKDALNRLMEYIGVESEEELKIKIKQNNERVNDIKNAELYTPNNLVYLNYPSVELIIKIRDVSNALGYTFMNTQGYESWVESLVGKLVRGGEKGKAEKTKGLFAGLKSDFENEKDKSEFQEIDENLLKLFQDKENFKKYIEEQKNLPPDAIVHLYHGLNSGGYEAALELLNGSSRGIEQHSGPTVSLTPIGQFWKGVGLRYALRRDQIEFPGENNPNAVVRMEGDDESAGQIVNESRSLPLDEFEAEIMRSNFTLPDPKLEKELVEKPGQFSEERNSRQLEQ